MPANGIDINLSGATSTVSGFTVNAGSNALASTLIGSDQADTISGASGGDSIVGGAGNDSLLGGAGADNLTGGVGANDFFNIGVGGDAVAVDTITDFVVANTDQIGGWEVSAFTAIGATLTDLNVTDTAVEATDEVQVFANAGAEGFDLDDAEANDNFLQLTSTFANLTAVTNRVQTFLSGDETAATEGFLLGWDDGTDSYVSLVDYAAVDTDGQAIASATVTNIAKISGIAANEAIVEANFFAFIA